MSSRSPPGHRPTPAIYNQAGIRHLTCRAGLFRLVQTEYVPGNAWTEPPGGWPPGLWQGPYMLWAGPGCDTPPSWLDGSNCQRFAYGVLAMFGLACPPLRSSDLWDDHASTTIVQDPGPLDLVLYNKTANPFGAHVALWMAPGEILHLCHEVGVLRVIRGEHE